MRQSTLAILLLTALLALIDQLYRVLHPEVNFARATLVGATAYLALRVLGLARVRLVSPVRGALAIAASAFGSVALIEAGWLQSRSAISALVHVAILAVAYLALGCRRSCAARAPERDAA
ncbi:MAG TPA: hypothetical protein VEC18_04930 [Myxococcota bacterium]|nr:hypothetical protein [Myxococcota bacterium]